MQEQIGKVLLTYEKEEAELQVPSQEDAKILELIESKDENKIDSFLKLYHFSHLRANLTQWLPIQMGQSVLEFGADSGQLTGSFLEKTDKVICLEESLSRSRILAKRYESCQNLKVFAGNPWKQLESLGKSFDWIIAVDLLADAKKYFVGKYPQRQAIAELKKYLKADGQLVLAADNRFALKYWAGALEPHTGKYFDSLEGNGSTFSKAQLEQILKESGCASYRFYYPYPERTFPMAMYSDAWLPKTGELNQNLRNFDGERLVLFEEEKVFDQLILEHRFPEFSNSYLLIVGQEIQLPLFVKYSNDRALEFQIRTDIVEEDGKRFVCKVPVSKEAREHIRKLKHWEQVLEEFYKKNNLHANRCELSGDKACFEFLEGQTYEEILDGFREEQNYAGLAEELQKYKQLLINTLEPEKKNFQKSSLFAEMFGNAEFTRAYEGAAINNLDWIFGNLIKTKVGIQIIDYEWTFEVQVPIEYLLWRALSLYLHSRKDLQGLGLMNQMGISEEEELLFAQMEHHFQLWLLGNTKTIGQYYMQTAGRTIYLEEMLTRAKQNRLQLYFDKGEGFSEAESIFVEIEPDKRGIAHAELLLPEGVKALRIDPAQDCCLVKVKRLLGELGGTYSLAYEHNGRELEKQGILYTTTDPQIVIPQLVEGTRRIYAEFSIELLHSDTAYACMNLLNRVRSAERIYNNKLFKSLKKLKNFFRK